MMDGTVGFDSAIIHTADLVDPFVQRWVVARKDHKCLECGDPIRPGDRYFLEKYSAEGELHTHRTCQDCMSIRDLFRSGFVYGMIWEDIQTEVQDGLVLDEEFLAELPPTAREKLLAFLGKVQNR